MERERRGEDDLAGVLDGFGQAPDELHDVCGAEGFGCNEIREGVAVEHWESRGRVEIKVGRVQERARRGTHGR